VLLNQDQRLTAIRGFHIGGIARQFLKYVLHRLANQARDRRPKELHAMRRAVI
jgi:hypothetical protein